MPWGFTMLHPNTLKSNFLIEFLMVSNSRRVLILFLIVNLPSSYCGSRGQFVTFCIQTVCSQPEVNIETHSQ